MFDKIRRFGTDTAVYGVSTILGRFLTFFLTPLYVNFLPQAEFGHVAYVYACIAFLNVVYAYGMETAYLRYTATLEIGDRKQNFSVPFLSLLVSSVLLSVGIAAFHDPLASALELPSHLSVLIVYGAVILGLDALAVIPFAALRLERHATRFAVIKTANIVVNVGCNVLFLVYWRMGIASVFLSNIIASAVTVLLLLPTIVTRLRWTWHRDLYAALLRFALPIVPQGVAAMMMQVVDRPILLAMTNARTLAVYQANYRLGIFMMLVVQMFDFAWRPFYLTHAADADAKQLFARILTYYLLVMSFVLVLLGLFVEDVVKLPLLLGRPILTAPYWTGLPIVSVILLAYVFLGLSNNFSAGIYIEKKTKHLPAITFAGAAANVVANLLLIPVLGIMGAALATLISYVLIASIYVVVARRFYPVRYEWSRVAKIAVCTGVVFLLRYLIPDLFAAVPWKLALVGLFVLLMYLLRFLEPSEIAVMGRMLRSPRRTVPEAPE